MSSAENPEFPQPKELPKPHNRHLWQPQDTHLKTEQIIANPYQDLRDSGAPQPTDATAPLVGYRRLGLNTDLPDNTAATQGPFLLLAQFSRCHYSVSDFYNYC